MANQGTGGLKRILKASSFSVHGLRAAFANEAAFRQECILSLILIPWLWFWGKTDSKKRC